MRLGEEQLTLHARPVLLERCQVALEIRGQRHRAGGIVFGQLRNLREAARAVFEPTPCTDLLAQLIGAAQERLRGGRVFPERGVRRSAV